MRLLILVSCFLIAGCGDSGDTNHPPPAPTTVASSGAAGSGGGGGAGGHGGGLTVSSATGSASGGAGGAGGTAGPGGNGSGGASGGAGGGNGGAGGKMLGLGLPCVWGDDCGPGIYCDALGCGAGICELRPNVAAIHAEEMPVCGCDGTTYWNQDTAAFHGVATAMAGECPGGGIPCDMFNPCPVGMACNRPIPDDSQCLANPAGVCWGIPFQCGLGGKNARACSDATCQTVCALIASQNPYYDDGTCP